MDEREHPCRVARAAAQIDSMFFSSRVPAPLPYVPRHVVRPDSADPRVLSDRGQSSSSKIAQRDDGWRHRRYAFIRLKRGRNPVVDCRKILALKLFPSLYMLLLLDDLIPVSTLNACSALPNAITLPSFLSKLSFS